ncbi:MAG: SDR family oxidoreductase, partial [Myxococcales bacterium]|nr:SDR family oxidoreductase [Myxococcales bacterium]
GKIDILVNNAGISGMQTPFLDIDEDYYDRMMDVNVKAAFFLSQMVVPGMRDQHWGRIVNVSSMFSMKGSPDAPHYTAAKSGLLGLTKALARELGPWNITVNAIAPGWVDTQMAQDGMVQIAASIGVTRDAFYEMAMSQVPLRRMLAPEEIADLVLFLASERGRGITGACLDINGGSFMG